jgi:hypothetical protein
MDLDKRLQLRPGMLVAIVGEPPDGLDLPRSGTDAAPAPGALAIIDSPDKADAVIAFARSGADLADAARPAIEAARQDKLAWIAYPKAGQLGTDLNRDRLVAAIAEHRVQPVRQVAIDQVWSALRFRPA